jgi:hypothetical protein
MHQPPAERYWPIRGGLKSDFVDFPYNHQDIKKAIFS